MGKPRVPAPGAEISRTWGAARDAFGHALTEAERSAGAFNQVRRSYFSASGAQLQGIVQTGSAAVAYRAVAPEDMRHALADAYSARCEPGRCLLLRRTQAYRIDGRRVRGNPLGHTGRRVEAECFRAETSIDAVAAAYGLSEYIGAPVREFIPASLAAAQRASTPEERESGVLVVDIGASVTDYVVYSGGRILATGVVPMGGDDVTFDLARELRLRHDDAETLKIALARAYATPEDKHEAVLFAPTPGVIGARRFVSQEIHARVEARLTRLLTPIRDAVAAVTAAEPMPVRHAIFTGKASAQTGFDRLAERLFGMRCERIEDREDKHAPFSDPRFSTAMGVLEIAHRFETAGRVPRLVTRDRPGKLIAWYRSTALHQLLAV